MMTTPPDWKGTQRIWFSGWGYGFSLTFTHFTMNMDYLNTQKTKKHLFSWPCLLSSCQAFLTQTKSWEAESWKLFKDQPFVWPELLKGKGSESPCVLLSVLTEAQGHPFRFAAGKDPAANWRQDSGGIKPLPWRCLPPTWGRKWRREKTCCFRCRVCYCQAVWCVYEKKVIKRERRPPTGPQALPSPPAPAHPDIAGCKRFGRTNRRCKSEKWRWSSMHLPVRVCGSVLHTLLGPNLGLASISLPVTFHPGPCSLSPLVSSCVTRRPPAYKPRKQKSNQNSLRR